ncbi:hypothetical protein BV898_06717 [Hypsibius exemplaris]|uniref:CLIP1 zinc knuckle domain-containing protein n=1 Tax=Hypsibius exemplaris TaxID=2072580 RepID=A0A1W0WVX0_HYPEX|nr:hypothetical protein BV898_06717 [Hypsibius exemplaris]
MEVLRQTKAARRRRKSAQADDRGYFTCTPNHGVFAPIAKVSKAPLPHTSDEPRTPKGLMTGMKRSPSQESMHSNFSVQSTASRRSSAIRLGTSSLSPSTVAVGRTGTGTAADIQKAHQEKDILIANLSRERDLARKELAAKSNQERDVHSEIQKLQEQYVGALSAQDARIQEMADALKVVEEEKQKLREALEDEKKKVEDIQFRLEEEQMSKDSGEPENDAVQKVLNEKNKEILSLKSDVETVKTELGRLQTSLALKDEEIEKWRLAADETKFKNSETADDRDRIAFEIADLHRQLRDATEKHRIELAAVQTSLQEKTAAEDELRKDITKQKDEIVKLSQEKLQLEGVKVASQQADDALSSVVREKEEIKARLRDANGHLSQANQEVARLKSEYDHLDAAVREKRTVMTGIFKEFADVAGPQSFDEEIPVLKQLLGAVQLRASQSVEAIRLELLESRKTCEASNERINQLTIDLNSVKAEREELSGKLQAVNAEKSTIMTETDLLKQRVESLQGDLSKATAVAEASVSASSSNLRRSLDDKTKENETLLYRLTELEIEYAETVRKTREDSSLDLSNAAAQHKSQLEKLSATHQSELESLRSKSEAHIQSVDARLGELTSALHKAEAEKTDLNQQLQKAEAEKADLNQQIGKFIEVLHQKDAELKDARADIEKTFAQEAGEKTELTTQLKDQQRKLETLDAEVTSLTALNAERKQEVDELSRRAAKSNEELVAAKNRADESEAKWKSLQAEVEQSKAAFAEQMVLAEVRHGDQLRAAQNERDSLVGTVAELKDQITALSAISTAEVDSLREQLSERLKESNIQLFSRTSELELSLNQISGLQADLDKARNEIGDMATVTRSLEERLGAVSIERDGVNAERLSLTEEVNDLRTSKQYLLDELNKAKKIADGAERSAAELNAHQAEVQRLLDSAKNESRDAEVAFARQITMAQMKTEELQKSADAERSSMEGKIFDLERQVAALLVESSSSLDAVRSDLQRRLDVADSECQSKSAALLSLQSEMASTQEKVRKAEAATHIAVSSLKSAEDRIAALSGEVEDANQRSLAAEDALRKFHHLPASLAQTESQLATITADLTVSQAKNAQMEAQHAESVTKLGSLSKALDERNTRLSGLDAETAALKAKNARLQESLAEGSLLAEEMTKLRAAMETLVGENKTLTASLADRTAELTRQRTTNEELRTGMDVLRQTKAAEEAKKSAQADDRGTLNALLNKELERVKSEVDAHRRLLQQKDSEISMLRDRAVQGDTAAAKASLPLLTPAGSSASSSAGEKNEFQVQILNSIIADQQNKILDLERRLQETAAKTVESVVNLKDSTEPKLPPVRRAIRLYCGTCQKFDLHDGQDCPTKFNKASSSSPERERKPKAPARPPRKYCDECEVFEMHDTADCPELLKKNSARQRLQKPAVSIRNDHETF